MTGLLDNVVRRLIQDSAAVQERAAEESIQSGVHGFVTVHDDLVTRAFVHAAVPYGQHFIFPSLTAYDRWVENGHPS
ncbi:hypothetical protein SEA_PUREGLOBE5_3 [Arthrobacter phage Pureglobe5]|nr:hypothetical protein SEA_ODYSSEY395_3 [Arthrobacter phage Odyssey395]UYL87366.1 hypothetical protein SEA_PUREGLOBE5_3 [Arthrobacter phage Pureglobe5]